MKYLNMILAAVLVGIVAVNAAQDTTFSQREIRDPRKLEAILEANATDAETRLAAAEAGTSIGLASNLIFVGQASAKAGAVAVTGDISITTNGVVEITADSIINADIKSDAAIVSTKLATAVQTSLGKADTALQPAGNLTGQINSIAVATVTDGAAAGALAVPKTDLWGPVTFTNTVDNALTQTVVVTFCHVGSTTAITGRRMHRMWFAEVGTPYTPSTNNIESVTWANFDVVHTFMENGMVDAVGPNAGTGGGVIVTGTAAGTNLLVVVGGNGQINTHEILFSE